MKDEINIKNSSIHILLIDNITLEMKFLKELFIQHNFQVTLVEGEQNALEWVRENHPQILISDVENQNIDSYRLSSMIKSDPETKDTSVIFLTQVSGPTDIIKGLESGADNFIMKPYNNKHLLSRLHDILLGRELRKQKNPDEGLDVFFGGQMYTINSNKIQVMDLLFSVLENTIRKNEELQYVYNRMMAAMDNIRNLDKLKNDFISSVSHEIRTPLTSIRGALRLVQGVGGEMSDKSKNLIEIASRNSDRLLLLLNDILDIQKIESGQITFQFGRHSLEPLLKQAIEVNNALAEKYNIKIKLQKEITTCKVNVDPDRLVQVITNLLSNATKFSPEGESVYLRVKEKKTNIRISVIDKGPGIPENYRATIYDKFTQTQITTSQQKEGTGLGLNIAKTLIEKMNGTINFKSLENRGTTFYIELPKIHE